MAKEDSGGRAPRAPEGQARPRRGRQYLVYTGIGLVAYFASFFLTAGVLHSASLLPFVGLLAGFVILLTYLARRLGLLGDRSRR
ncbi:MAG: hypothetical protein EXR60_00735 [Dehalococcoidia bacterium]|nr:hypothetical protein [Dehalococcoidia bacterium]